MLTRAGEPFSGQVGNETLTRTFVDTSFLLTRTPSSVSESESIVVRIASCTPTFSLSASPPPSTLPSSCGSHPLPCRKLEIRSIMLGVRDKRAGISSSSGSALSCCCCCGNSDTGASTSGTTTSSFASAFTWSKNSILTRALLWGATGESTSSLSDKDASFLLTRTPSSVSESESIVVRIASCTPTFSLSASPPPSTLPSSCGSHPLPCRKLEIRSIMLGVRDKRAGISSSSGSALSCCCCCGNSDTGASTSGTTTSSFASAFT
mmetsp:Transcript_28699/g.47563  ORF Transcript_28699/g.47563 Transcript_28699/m.47563 type:complete len:264 (+) Transcript_28699:660-1451(+)